MEGWKSESFGNLNAAGYDDMNDPGTTEAAVDLIAEVSGGGRILELAVGTGRIALPLAARGLDVTGLEISPEMVAELRRKPGGAALDVVIGDMEEVAVEGTFDLVVLVFNTFFNLTSQASQVRCFQNAAKRLAPGGRFLIETFVPDTSRFVGHQVVRVKGLDMERLALDCILHDPVAQVLNHQRLHVTNVGTQLIPLVMRYAYPPEMDLMAQLAGLELRERWGGWGREPFSKDSVMHISVWGRA